MQHDSIAAVQRLRTELAPLKGLWRGVESDLTRMGVCCLADLRGRSAQELVDAYCAATRRPFDRMLQPVFASIVRYSDSGVAVPWWRIMRDEAIRDRQAAVSAITS